MSAFPCLILTPWYAPHHVLTCWHDTITALYTDKIDVLVEYEEAISSPSVTLRLPAVAKLRRNPPRVRREIRFSRGNVYLRDDYRCQYCGERKHPSKLTYDHVLPYSRGGRTDFGNVVAACMPCNLRKRNRTPEEAGMPLLTQPRKPSSLPVQAKVWMPSRIPAEWLLYLPADMKETG